MVKFSATRLRELPSYLTGLRAIAADAAQVRLPIQMNAEEVRSYHLDSIIEECIRENARREFAWDLHIRALLYLLITGIARFWIGRRESFLDQIPKERSPILDIPPYIEEHISESLRVEDLAARCGMSYREAHHIAGHRLPIDGEGDPHEIGISRLQNLIREFKGSR